MKRVLCTLTAAALCAAVTGCTAQGSAGATATPSDSSDNKAQTEQTRTDEATSDEPLAGQVDAKTGAIGPAILEDPFETGIHHAWLKVKGYPRMELEIYSTDAPKTSALFCKLVRKGYYNDMQLEALMPGLYAQLGDASGKTEGEHLVDAEFEEAGYHDNHLGLKRGVIAMSRTDITVSGTTKAKKAKTKVKSDASHFYVFLTNASYLDGKYAGFAKITSGISTFDEICSAVQSGVKTDKKGKIKKVEKCPVIKYITLED